MTVSHSHPPHVCPASALPCMHDTHISRTAGMLLFMAAVIQLVKRLCDRGSSAEEILLEQPLLQNEVPASLVHITVMHCLG